MYTETTADGSSLPLWVAQLQIECSFEISQARLLSAIEQADIAGFVGTRGALIAMLADLRAVCRYKQPRSAPSRSIPIKITELA
jgi:hypothetical protein